MRSEFSSSSSASMGGNGGGSGGSASNVAGCGDGCSYSSTVVVVVDGSVEFVSVI